MQRIGLTMKIDLGRKAHKFLEKLDKASQSKIKEKVNILRNSLENSGAIPINILDIKTLRGEWYPMKRLRIGNYRIIFYIDNDLLKIPVIDNRGDIY